MANVLIADADRAHTGIVDLLLSLDGHQVDAVASGREALAYLREHTPDLIILDIHLPELSGIELCKRIKKVTRLKSVPVMILTAERNRSLLDHATLVAADEVVPKPLEGKDFRSMVSALLRPKAA